MTQKAALIWRYWWFWVSFLLIWRLMYYIVAQIESQQFEFSYSGALFMSDIGSASAITILPALSVLVIKSGISGGISFFHWMYFLLLNLALSLLFTVSIPSLSQYAGSTTIINKVMALWNESSGSTYQGVFSSIRISFSFFAISFVLSSIAFHRFFWVRYKAQF